METGNFKKSFLIFMFAALSLSFFGFQGNLSAEVVTAEIVSVNQDDGFLTIQKISPTDQAGKEMKVFVSDKTQLNGVQSLDDLQVGDEVTLETNRKFFFGPWQVNNLSRSQAVDAGTDQPLDQEASTIEPGATQEEIQEGIEEDLSTAQQNIDESIQDASDAKDELMSAQNTVAGTDASTQGLSQENQAGTNV